ncbi:helix-turn-helix transcriptional regulator [Clostridium niameyense]|uniref:Helix-turn-helix transcriptional regulator n=1 Tax=Clostridium niameyense TaxID=1622073 RepID=A0A6M0R911_9CLOT|nr:helix-turn-helix transcriptional regulator [Clostridium niameyense]NEZ45718.1 helix-turn-helix transcriptional regulator [Clostridium niameyense]
MNTIKLSERQEQIVELVKKNEPITSENLATHLGVTRAALRPDLAILTMIGILEAKPKVGYIYSHKPSYSFLQDYIESIVVKNIMSDPIMVEESTTVYDSILHLFLNDVGTIFIHNDGILVGAVSRKDFLKIAMGGTDMHKVPVGIIMTRMPNIVYVDKEDNAYVAAQKIIDHEVDSLPVVDKVVKNGKEELKIIGKVSKTNITRLFVKLGENS